MKKILWSLALVSTLIIGCSKPEEERKPEPKPDPTPEKPEEKPQEPEGPVAECDWADFLITLEFTTPSTTEYYVDEVNYSTLQHKDGKLVHELLDFSSWDDMVAAMGELGGSPETGAEVLYMGNDPGTGYDITQAFNTNGIGYWCNGQGSVQNWGNDARIYSEAYFDEAGALIADVGVMANGVIKAGETYTCRMVFQRTKSETEIIRVGIEFKVSIEEFVDPEAGKYDASKRTTGTVNVDVSVDLPVGSSVSVDIAKQIQDALQMTKHELTEYTEAVYDDDTNELLKGIDYTNYVGNEPVLVTVGADGSQLENPRKHTSAGYGNWMSFEHVPIIWGTEGMAYYIEMHVNNNAIDVAFGTDDPNIWEEQGEGNWVVVGENDYVRGLIGTTMDTYKTVITYIPDFDATPTVINVNYTINFLAPVE